MILGGHFGAEALLCVCGVTWCGVVWCGQWLCFKRRVIRCARQRMNATLVRQRKPHRLRQLLLNEQVCFWLLLHNPSHAGLYQQASATYNGAGVQKQTPNCTTASDPCRLSTTRLAATHEPGNTPTTHHDHTKQQLTSLQCAQPESATLHPAAYLVCKQTKPIQPNPTQSANTTEKPQSNKPPTRLELQTPCKPNLNLLTCPDFSASQPNGPASIPHLHGLPCCTRIWECPRCGDGDGDAEPDLRFKRLREVRMVGVKIGGREGDARRERGRGVEVGVGCCSVM